MIIIAERGLKLENYKQKIICQLAKPNLGQRQPLQAMKVGRTDKFQNTQN